jgi:hypothetical protein
MQIILPNTYIVKEELYAHPLIFLAGPIRGAPLWQDEAIDLLFKQRKDLVIANPRRGVRKDLQPYVVTNERMPFDRQRAWERYYLEIASKTGSVAKKKFGTILFWLAGEVDHKCDKSYGAMTRMELGYWTARYKADPRVNLCVGSDGKFSELRTLTYDLSCDAPDKKIHETLEETCKEALRLATPSP